jgi:type I restriction enzyme, S subunit
MVGELAESAKPMHLPSRIYELPSGWTWLRLDDACEGVFDCPHSTPKLVNDGPFIVRSQDIITGVFRAEQAACVSEETYRERTSRVAPRRGDLLYSREGTYFGIAAEVPERTRVCLGQRMVLIRPRASLIDFRFLRYWLNSPIMAAHIHGYRDGTVAERLNLPTIRALPVLLPPLPEQGAIAHILGTLDDKIELNRRMNETLEAMARALFKSWFVDFGPVRAKAEGKDPGLPKPLADLFPDSFEDSELGEIPKGWANGTVADLCDAIYSGGTPSTQIAEYWNGDVPWLSSGETRDTFIIDTEKRVTTAGVSNSSTREARSLSTVIASAGQGNTRGQTSLLVIDSYVNQSVVVLSANRRTSSPLHLFFDLERRYDEFRRVSDGHSSRGSLTTKLLAGLGAVLPPFPLIERFETAVFPAVERAIRNLRESNTLAALRDTLLPKLISGELQVPEAGRAVQRAV